MTIKKCSRCSVDKNIEEFPRDKSSKDGRSPDCKLCRKRNRNKEWSRKSYHKNKIYYSQYREKSQAFIRKCKETLGCYFCKMDKAACLDFHHLRDKKYDATKVNSINAILKELEKCICVCANCHRLIHSQELIVPLDYKIDIGTLKRGL